MYVIAFSNSGQTVIQKFTFNMFTPRGLNQEYAYAQVQLNNSATVNGGMCVSMELTIYLYMGVIQTESKGLQLHYSIDVSKQLLKA